MRKRLACAIVGITLLTTPFTRAGSAPHNIVLVDAHLLSWKFIRPLEYSWGNKEHTIVVTNSSGYFKANLKVLSVLVGRLKQKRLSVTLRNTYGEEQVDNLYVLLEKRRGDRFVVIGWQEAGEGVCFSKEVLEQYRLAEAYQRLSDRHKCHH